MKPSLPVVALSGLGIVIAVLGFFAAGNIAFVVVGLGAIFAGGVIGVAERFVDRQQPPVHQRREEDHQ